MCFLIIFSLFPHFSLPSRCLRAYSRALNRDHVNDSPPMPVSAGLVLAVLFGLLVALLGALYALVLVFRHLPRSETANERKYITNDGLGDQVYELPPRLGDAKSIQEPTTDLSVVIPCYNETLRLGVMLDDAIGFLRTTRKRYEIIIVDDGSKDGTAEYALQKAAELKLGPHIMKIVKLDENRGKGGAVTHGLLHSLGRLALFADADGATTFSDAEKLILYLDGLPENTPGIAIGSRAHMVNTEAVVKRSFIRNFLMYGLHTLVYVFGIRGVQDTQCGFKMFNRQAVAMIFPHMHTERWIFDVEVLLLGEIQHIPMREIAVNWQEIGGSKIDLARDSIGMAIDLVVTRLAYIFLVYKVEQKQKQE